MTTSLLTGWVETVVVVEEVEMFETVEVAGIWAEAEVEGLAADAGSAAYWVVV